MATTEDERALRSVSDIAADTEEEESEDDGTPQLVIPGTGPKLDTKVGGRKPTESYFKMSGVSLAIAGNVQIDKDTEMWVAIPVAIDDIRLRNRRKDGEIVSVARTHLAIATGQPIILEHAPAAAE